MRTIAVNSTIPADTLIFAGDGLTLLSNTDVNNVIWLSFNAGMIPNDPARSIPLGPLSTLVMDGEADVFGITSPGKTANLLLIEGGVSYFQSGITGSGFLANSDGAFFYSGLPGAGNLIEAITGSNASGKDPFGNTYQPGGTDIFQPGKLLIYAGQPALGNLLIALAGASGGDTPGNTWAQGATIFGANGNPVGVSMPTTNPREIFNAFIAAGVLNPGGGNNVEQGFLELVSPRWTGDSGESTMISLLAPKLNSLTSAFGALTYVDRNGAQHQEAIWGQGGLFSGLVNLLTAIQPGTADTTLASETWHTIPLAAGWTPAAVPPQYRMLPDGNVQITGLATHAAFTATTALSASPIPSGYWPSSTQVVPAQVVATDCPIGVSNAGVVSAFAGGTSYTQARSGGIYARGV